jgi:hypothetical protein
MATHDKKSCFDPHIPVIFRPVLHRSIDKGFRLMHLGKVAWISHEALTYTVREIVRLRGTHNSLGIFERLLHIPYHIRYLRDMKPFFRNIQR